MKKTLKKLLVTTMAVSMAALIPSGCGLLPSSSAFSASVTAQAALRSSDDLSYKVSWKTSDERQKLVNTALSLEGKIPYVWGGKASAPGWNKSWDNRQTGMDCSGFVQWAYWTALNKKDGLSTTAQITDAGKSIDADELKPGDVGLLFAGGSHYEDASGKSFETEEAAQASNQKKAEKKVRKQLKEKAAQYGDSKTLSARADTLSQKAQDLKAQAADCLSQADDVSDSNPDKADRLTAKAGRLKDRASDASDRAGQARKQARTARKKEAAATSKEAVDKAVKQELTSPEYNVRHVTNHVGIYAGKDKHGNRVWIHCNSSNNTVSVNHFSGFTVYRRIITGNEHYTTRDRIIHERELRAGIKKLNTQLKARELYRGPAHVRHVSNASHEKKSSRK